MQYKLKSVKPLTKPQTQRVDPTDTIDQSEVKMNAFATQYVATKYPNT